jgi:hypothetical protein
MFCPHCGQQQAAGDKRFCSRCGFPLLGVAKLLSSGGIEFQGPSADPRMTSLSPRQRGVRQGAMMMLLTLLAVPLVAILSVYILGSPQLFVPLTAISLFVGGMLRIIYAILFQDGQPVNEFAEHDRLPAYEPPQRGANLGAGAYQPALPPQRSTPVSPWQKPRNTAELAVPPSVTENTTRLLDNEPDAESR